MVGAPRIFTAGALTTGPASLTPVAVPRGGGSMSKQNLKQKAYRELKEFVIITLYLTVVFVVSLRTSRLFLASTRSTLLTTV